MTSLDPIDAPISLDPLAARIRASSNFRFSWQWFSYTSSAPTGTGEARNLLDSVVDRPDCHAFLIESLDPGPFSIARPHEHVGFVASNRSFEQVLARAAADQLGAYSRILSDATLDQALEIRGLFAALGPYAAFELTPGNVAGCPDCKDYNNHLFTSWFHGVFLPLIQTRSGTGRLRVAR